MKKIILIEDQQNHLLLMKRTLEDSSCDYLIEAFGDSQKALEAIFEQNYDLIICNDRIPQMSAFDILSAMKEKGNR